MRKYLLLFSVLIFAFACKKEEDEIVLIPEAGPNQLVIPLELVTLDGTASTGPEGYTFEWIYEGSVPEQDIDLQNVNSLNPTFTPPVSDNYFFTLKISYDGQSSSDQVMVEASGAIVLGGTLNDNLALKNLEPDNSKPDYIIASDLIVLPGFALTVVEDGVVVEVKENKGIIVRSGAGFSNYNSATSKGFNVILNSQTSWKGILVDGGSINLQDSRVENAGDAVFEDHYEAAALVIAESSTIENNFSDNSFTGSSSIDFLIEGQVTMNGSFTDNSFSYPIPVKVPVDFLHFIEEDNVYPENYDYIYLMINEEVIVTLPEYDIFKMYEEKYYLDGILHLGADLFINAGAHLYFKEGSGMVGMGDGSISVQDWTGSQPAYFDGLNGATWLGLAIKDNANIYFRSSILNNAGYGTFNTSIFQSDNPATIYMANNKIFRFENCELKNSGGYGIYYTGATGTYIFNIENSRFENTAMPAIRTTVRATEYFLKSGHANNFMMNDAVAAIQVDADTTFYDLKGTWQALGGDNYYLITTDIIRNLDLPFKLEPGVILRFKENKSLIWNYAFNDVFSFKAIGTAEDPIILDSENENVKWGGIKLSGQFEIDHVQIKNAGSIILPGAPVACNIFIALNAYTSSYPLLRFKNSLISGSAGYGAIVNEYITPSADPSNPDNNITFSDNELGDIYTINK